MVGHIESMSCTISDFLPGKGRQFLYKDRRVAVGAICDRHFLEWERPINLTPDDLRWQDLFFAALLEQGSGCVSVVCGCPHSMIKEFKGKIPKGVFKFDLPEGRREIEILNSMAVPECAGHALAFSELLGDACIVVSIGFGTVEIGAANSNGVIANSLESVTYGLHHCASPWRETLERRAVDCSRARPDQYFYFDRLLRRVYMKDESLVFQCRTGESLDCDDFYEESLDVLKDYATMLVPRIKGYFTRFTDKMPVILTGGGVNYAPVREILEKMFKEMRYTVKIADPEKSLVSAAAGYRIAARQQFGATGVGIDVGNHNVVVMGSK